MDGYRGVYYRAPIRTTRWLHRANAKFRTASSTQDLKLGQRVGFRPRNLRAKSGQALPRLAALPCPCLRPAASRKRYDSAPHLIVQPRGTTPIKQARCTVFSLAGVRRRRMIAP
jgi:hypothetical protein